MPKFFSTMVFLFGGLMILVVGFFMVQRYLPDGSSTVRATLLPPPSDLPPLDLGSPEDFQKTLDRLDTEGGLGLVQRWVEGQLVPGRLLVVGDTTPSRRLSLVDREMRPCTPEGVPLFDRPAQVDRTSRTFQLGTQGVTHTWTRSSGDSPFTLTVWSVPASP